MCFQNQMKSFMDKTFEKIQNTERALNVLKRFERWVSFYSVFLFYIQKLKRWVFFPFWIRLGIPDLGIDEKYQSIFQNYGQDIEMVSRIYMKQKTDPPIGRDMPPVAGRIMWVRQLYSRIQGPMDLFQKVLLNLWLSRSAGLVLVLYIHRNILFKVNMLLCSCAASKGSFHTWS